VGSNPTLFLLEVEEMVTRKKAVLTVLALVSLSAVVYAGWVWTRTTTRTTTTHFNPYVEYVGNYAEELWLDLNESRLIHRNDELEMLRERGDNVVYFITLYHYRFGIAGKWNYTISIQEFKQKLTAITGTSECNPPKGCRTEPFPWVEFIVSPVINPSTNHTFEKGIEIIVPNELTAEQIKEIENLIQNNLY
jgi:hypothetical protein